MRKCSAASSSTPRRATMALLGWRSMLLVMTDTGSVPKLAEGSKAGAGAACLRSWSPALSVPSALSSPA